MRRIRLSLERSDSAHACGDNDELLTIDHVCCRSSSTRIYLENFYSLQEFVDAVDGMIAAHSGTCHRQQLKSSN